MQKNNEKKQKKSFFKKNNANNESLTSKDPLNLSKREKQQIKKRNQKKDIILDLNNKYKDYETEAVFKFYEKFKDDEEKKSKDKTKEKRKRKNLLN